MQQPVTGPHLMRQKYAIGKYKVNLKPKSKKDMSFVVTKILGT